MSQDTIVVGLCYVELTLEQGCSLKDKRRVIKSITDRIKGKFNVSVAEVNHQDLWQLAGLAFSHVSNSGALTTKVLSAIVGWLDGQGEFYLTDYTIQIL